MQLRKQLLHGSLGSVTLRVFHMAIVFGNAILLARLLGPEGYGVYSYVLALVALLAIPAQFGLPTLVTREIASYQALQQWGLFKGIVIRANQAAIALSGVLLSVAGVILIFLSYRFSTSQLSTFLLGLLLVPMGVLGVLRGAVLRGLRKVVQGQLPEQIVRPGVLFVCLLFYSISASEEKLTSEGAMLFHVVGCVVAFAVGSFLLWIAYPSEAKGVEARFETSRWMASVWPLALLSGIQLINQYVDILLLGIFHGARETGIFRIASQSATLAAIALVSVDSVIGPHMARLYVQKDMTKLQRIVRMSSLAIFLATLPIALVFICYGGSLIDLAYGPGFRDGWTVLAILSAAQIVNASTGSVGALMNMTGHERITAKAVAAAAIANMLFGLVLIPMMGATGAAISGALSLVTWNVLLWYAARKYLAINSLAFSALR